MGELPPAESIPIAEDCGQILPIGEWVLFTALQQLQHWLAADLGIQTVAANLSAVQFCQPGLPERVAQLLSAMSSSMDSPKLELTEGVAVEDTRAAIATMNKLRACGVRLSVDDFGIGYSSLSHLKRSPIYKLKIGRSFVSDLSDDANDRALVSAIIRMAQALGIATTAEGVKTQDQSMFLQEQGCAKAQAAAAGPCERRNWKPWHAPCCKRPTPCSCRLFE